MTTLQQNAPRLTDPEISKKTSQPWITCIVPAFNEADGITAFINALCHYLSGITGKYDVIVVDDGSDDETGLKVIAASGGLPVRLLGLSRNFGKESAISAGLDQAEGEVVIVIDSDFQQPIATIGDFINRWQQGYDMVYGLRNDRKTDPPLRRFLSRTFYQILSRGASIDIPPDAGDFRLMDRRVVHAMRQLPESDKFMKGLYNWVGFRKIAVPFDYADRQTGSSKFNLSRLFELAMTGLTSFSSFPLRIWLGVGLAISSVSLIYAFWIIGVTLLRGPGVPGWATLVVAILFLGGMQLMSIGILGEYIGRIFNQVKGRPNYVVAERHGFPADPAPK
jgi:polyisoprenyl-phosphate glycosyltransferase